MKIWISFFLLLIVKSSFAANFPENSAVDAEALCRLIRPQGRAEYGPIIRFRVYQHEFTHATIGLDNAMMGTCYGELEDAPRATDYQSLARLSGQKCQMMNSTILLLSHANPSRFTIWIQNQSREKDNYLCTWETF